MGHVVRRGAPEPRVKFERYCPQFCEYCAWRYATRTESAPNVALAASIARCRSAHLTEIEWSLPGMAAWTGVLKVTIPAPMNIDSAIAAPNLRNFFI